MDQPTIDGINTYLISRCAHEVGLKVALSGLEGDELFGGYPSFQLIPKLLQRKKLFKYIPFMKWGVGFCKGLFPSDQATKLEHLVQGELSGPMSIFSFAPYSVRTLSPICLPIQNRRRLRSPKTFSAPKT